MSMHTWFECKIRYEKTMENGMNKKVTEPYLVDALSFTEAEARIIEEMTPFITGEFTVSDIKRANYSELFPSDEEAAPLVQMQADLHHTGREKRCRKEIVNAGSCAGCRPERCRQETRRRHERYHGRLSDWLCSRNSHHGCISIQRRTQRQAGSTIRNRKHLSIITHDCRKSETSIE